MTRHRRSAVSARTEAPSLASRVATRSNTFRSTIQAVARSNIKRAESFVVPGAGGQERPELLGGFGEAAVDVLRTDLAGVLMLGRQPFAVPGEARGVSDTRLLGHV